MQPSQLLGLEFVNAIFKHNWRLDEAQRQAKYDTTNADNCLAVRFISPENPGTHSIIASPSWLFSALGGFDKTLVACAAAGRDFWQRILMCEKEATQPQVITGLAFIGKDLAHCKPDDHMMQKQPLSAKKMWADENDDEAFGAIEESERLCKDGEVVRNGGPSFNQMMAFQVEYQEDNADEDDDINQRRVPLLYNPEEDGTNDDDGFTEDKKLDDLVPLILSTMSEDWMKHLKEWKLPEARAPPCTNSQESLQKQTIRRVLL